MCHTLDPVYSSSGSSCLSAYYWQGLWWKEIAASGSRGQEAMTECWTATAHPFAAR